MGRRNTSDFALEEDSLWYKDAILYELHVRAFRDSDGDGIGDFRGLIERLDYLQDLGVTALWLLQFYPSPCAMMATMWRIIQMCTPTMGPCLTISSCCGKPTSGASG